MEMSKQENLAPGQEKTLLSMSLKNSSETVFVPTSPGQQMWLPPMVILLQLGSDFWGQTRDHLDVGDLFVAVNEDIFIIDEMKSVGGLDSLVGVVGSFTNYLK